MEIGKTQVLKIAKENPKGFFLEDQWGENVFLPKIFAEQEWRKGDEVEVFVYQDNDQLCATIETPFCEVGEFAVMTCVQALPSGAFMDWGIIKDLFIPYKQQKSKILEGKKYLVYVFIDEETQRLTGTTKFNKSSINEGVEFKKGDKVSLIMANSTELGWNVVINKKHWGLVYQSDIYKDIFPLSEEVGYIKNIREDGKIDVSLQPEGFSNIDEFKQKILSELDKGYGLLYLSDKSTPEEIKDALQMSKKNFKKAIGGLYKDKIIEIFDDKIRLK
ncbi:MAG: S1-like domain-containing RNA-binding protein [Flavobacteriaceae bacterium]|nr:S1-like domain-containing RNA-binding protein [Flavobacteriaceae bacterium]